LTARIRETVSSRPSGAVFSARHSYMPNSLGYCGPDENEALFEAALQNKPTKKLVETLEQFKGAYPYQRFIAEASRIHDPFDYRVTEAYWFGNSLLDSIPPDAFYNHLKARLDKRFPSEHVKRFFDQQSYASFPNHALHVFNAFSGMGTVPDSFASGQGPDHQVGRFMDQCRVSWGRVTGIEDQGLTVECEPVLRQAGKLVLGKPAFKRIVRQVEGRGFVDDVQLGDWVSFHWGFAASILSESQVSNLRKYTLRSMQIANTVPVPM
jgi:hydrogenase maturation factor